MVLKIPQVNLAIEPESYTLETSHPMYKQTLLETLVLVPIAVGIPKKLGDFFPPNKYKDQIWWNGDFIPKASIASLNPTKEYRTYRDNLFFSAIPSLYILPKCWNGISMFLSL